MGLYERLLGRTDAGAASVEGMIPVHPFQALMAEVARGRLTGAQAQTAIETISGMVLTTAERTEAQTLLASIAGSTIAKLARAKEIDDVLLLATARSNISGYITPTEIRTRLGV
jgi:TnpA family transposase